MSLGPSPRLLTGGGPLFALILWAGSALAAEPRVGELGRIGPTGQQILMLGVDAPGFEDLTPRERVLAYFLNRAAIAGDAIFAQQVHRDAPDIITLLHEIDLHGETLDPAAARAIREELLRVIIHHGQYDQRQHRKHGRWSLTPELLAEATRKAELAGARLPRKPGEDTAAMLQRLSTALLDASVDAVHVEQNRGADIVAQSAVNLYGPGVTQAMIEGLLPFWQEKINVHFSLKDGDIQIQPFKVGGLFNQELWNVSYWLKKALPLAQSREQADSIHALIDFYATGDEGLYREHGLHWLRSDTRVDYLNGFVETYLDPRGVIGSFEANVGFQSDSTLVRKLAENAQYFESRMPWDKKWQRAKVEVPVSSVMNVLLETGDGGPISATAYNLPNYHDIQRDHGSKNVVLLNIEMARSEDVRRALIQEFYPEEDRANAQELGDLSQRWLIYMHEVIGHGSGQLDASVSGLDKSTSGRTSAALEECRADLVALYHFTDPRLLEVGAFPSRDVQERAARDALVSYLAHDLISMKTDVDLTLREAHRRANHLVAEYLLDGGGKKKDYGIRRQVRAGRNFLVVTDMRKARQGLADLLALLQKLKSTADDQGATELFVRYGTRLDAKLRDEMVQRAGPLNLPTLTAFAFPRLVPVVQGGDVVDARRVHDEDILSQHRRFRRIAFETSLEPSN